MVEINLVRTQSEADSVYEMAYEFIEWLRDRYPEMGMEIDTYLAHQNFDEQIRRVLEFYNPPKGECLLAVYENSPIGILMLKDLGGDICEMNRMYVRPSGRGLGVGRSFVERLKERAKSMGFRAMILSALPRHHEAIALYKSVGFKMDNRSLDEGGTPVEVRMKLDLATGEPCDS